MIEEWAHRWGIPATAIADLRQTMGVRTDPMSRYDDATTEAGVSQRVRLEYAKNTHRLWRNNVGVLNDKRGVPVRFGLANDSKQLNQVVKSSDLIGITQVRIEQHHVGSIIGQFTAIETKKPGWKYTGTKREVAQLKYHELVISMGGIGRFLS